MLAVAALAVPAFAPTSAVAAQPFVLGTGIFPHVAVDAAGTAHVTWRIPTGATYCQVPRGATACVGTLKLTPTDTPSKASNPYVLLGTGGKVYVVMPRWVHDVQLWTSNDGGASFSAGQKVGGDEAGATTGVPILNAAGSGIYVPSTSTIDGLAIIHHVGLTGFSDQGAELPLEDAGTVAVGLHDGKPVLISDDGQAVWSFRYDGSGPVNDKANWIGPTPVGPGRVVTAASGPAGLFVQHFSPTGGYVARRFDGTAFGAPTAVSEPNTFAPGPEPNKDPFLSNLTQNSSGRLDSVWIGQGETLRHGVSTDGGASFATSTLLVATPGARYSVATAPDGYGLVTWYNDETIFGARLDPLAPPKPPDPPKPPPPPPPPPSLSAGCGKGTSKLSLARATFDRSAGTISILAPITRLASGSVEVTLRAAGRTTRFDAPIDTQKGRVRVTRRIGAAQARMGSGIITINYPGDADTRAQSVRLRAANTPAGLRVTRPQITSSGFLRASGRVSAKARGVVRVQLEYVNRADGLTVTLQRSAPITKGRWSVNSRLSPSLRRQIARRCGTVHSYTAFTGYLPRRLRGELHALQVLAAR